MQWLLTQTPGPLLPCAAQYDSHRKSCPGLLLSHEHEPAAHVSPPPQSALCVQQFDAEHVHAPPLFTNPLSHEKSHAPWVVHVGVACAGLGHATQLDEVQHP